MQIKGNSIRILAALALAGSGSMAHADWHYGVGTGITANDWDGDVTVGTAAGDLPLDVELDAGDFMDALETAFGLAGYATDGTWVIQASFGVLELEGDAADGATRGDVDFDRDSAEVVVTYPFYSSDSIKLGVLGGFAYTSHDFELNITNGDASLSADQDGSWIDFVLGASMSVPFGDNWAWNSVVRGEFGDSEGVGAVSTGVNWRFGDSWSASATLKYRVAEYESGDEGDIDYYNYDVDEASFGIGFLYNW